MFWPVTSGEVRTAHGDSCLEWHKYLSSSYDATLDMYELQHCRYRLNIDACLHVSKDYSNIRRRHKRGTRTAYLGRFRNLSGGFSCLRQSRFRSAMLSAIVIQGDDTKEDIRIEEHNRVKKLAFNSLRWIFTEAIMTANTVIPKKLALVRWLWEIYFY